MSVRWSNGIEPRNLHWVIKGHMAFCERPGGYGGDHRPVRRRSENLWIANSEFTLVISLLPGPYNLNSYREAELNYLHLPLSEVPQPEELCTAFEALRQALSEEERVLIHHEKLGETLVGFLACNFLWLGLAPTPSEALACSEHLLAMPAGQLGREMMSLFSDAGLAGAGQQHSDS